MFFEQIWLDAVARGIFLGALALFWIILLVRAVGLRSFSKMTNFDFVTTVATGSLLAGAAQETEWPALVQTMSGIAGLFAVQYSVSLLRRRSDSVKGLIENEPVVLFENGKFSENALNATRVAKSDVIAKLREANALVLSDVRAVVLETTGDISVLHGSDVDEVLLESVIRYP